MAATGYDFGHNESGLMSYVSRLFRRESRREGDLNLVMRNGQAAKVNGDYVFYNPQEKQFYTSPNIDGTDFTRLELRRKPAAAPQLAFAQ